jgi:fatty-acyl-CoA synthase
LSAYFGEFIQVWAQQRPEKTAIYFEGNDYSYAWLENQVRHANRWLSERRVGRGDRVAYLGFNHPMMLVLLFALARRGAILVPLNYRLTPHEHAQQLTDAEPAFLIADPTHFQLAQNLGVVVRPVEDLQDVRVEQSNRAMRIVGADSYQGQLNDDLLLVYTSGTTGAPKGAVLTQNALLWNALNSIHAHDLTSQDKVLIALPIFHVGGLNIMLTPALYVGAEVALEAKFDAGRYLDLVNRWRPTLSLLVPATMNALVTHVDWMNTDVSCLRLINTGSSIVPKALLQRWHDRGIPAAQVYGSTETAPIAIYLRQEDTARKLGSAGLCALHCQVKLLTAEGQLCATEEVGGILVKGPNVMRAYWRNAEATESSFVDGWFKTGDIAYQDSDGFYWVVGRSKDLIISGGENIYPAEIEALINEHAAVIESAVVGMADERWGEVPVLAIVISTDVKNEAIDSDFLDGIVTKQLLNRLAKFKWPKRVIAVQGFPKTALGKVRKEDLKILLDAQTPIVSADSTILK